MILAVTPLKVSERQNVLEIQNLKFTDLGSSTNFQTQLLNKILISVITPEKVRIGKPSVTCLKYKQLELENQEHSNNSHCSDQ